jgi:hypothetical protein
MKQQSGWQRIKKGGPRACDLRIDLMPCKWEQMVAPLGVTEDEAACFPHVRAWIERNWRRAYVPLTVLERLGIREVEI